MSNDGVLQTTIFTCINVSKSQCLQIKVHIDHYKVSLQCLTGPYNKAYLEIDEYCSSFKNWCLLPSPTQKNRQLKKGSIKILLKTFIGRKTKSIHVLLFFNVSRSQCTLCCGMVEIEKTSTIGYQQLQNCRKIQEVIQS